MKVIVLGVEQGHDNCGTSNMCSRSGSVQVTSPGKSQAEPRKILDLMDCTTDQDIATSTARAG